VKFSYALFNWIETSKGKIKVSYHADALGIRSCLGEVQVFLPVASASLPFAWLQALSTPLQLPCQSPPWQKQPQAAKVGDITLNWVVMLSRE
jgi:hypothetical protein